MKLVELEHNARMKLADSSLRVVANAEEYRQKVITWLAVEIDLDEAELQEVVSIQEAEVKRPYWAASLSFDYDLVHKMVKMDVPEHKSLFFIIEEKNGQLVHKGVYKVDNVKENFYDLGVALVRAADEWAKEQPESA